MKKYQKGVDRISSDRNKTIIINEMGKEIWEYFSVDEMFMFYNIRNMPHKPMLGRMMMN
jgi:hypothetical protein